MKCIQCERFPFCKYFSEEEYCDKYKKANSLQKVLTSGQCNVKIVIEEVK